MEKTQTHPLSGRRKFLVSVGAIVLSLAACNQLVRAGHVELGRFVPFQSILNSKEKITKPKVPLLPMLPDLDQRPKNAKTGLPKASQVPLELPAPVGRSMAELEQKLQAQEEQIGKLKQLINTHSNRLGEIEAKLDVMAKENGELRKRLQSGFNAPPSQSEIPATFPIITGQQRDASAGNQPSTISPALAPYFVPAKPGPNLYFLPGIKAGERLKNTTDKLQIWTGKPEVWKRPIVFPGSPRPHSRFKAGFGNVF